MPSSPIHNLSIGIDFGTTNTVLAIAQDDLPVKTLVFDFHGSATTTFPSALCFWEERDGGKRNIKVEGGPWAIEEFLSATDSLRFIQSFKSFAASAAFPGTRIFNQPYSFEDLMATFLECLLRHAAPQLTRSSITRLIVGRPVHFAGHNPQDALAMQRYHKAFAKLGFDQVSFVYEPVGAAFFAAQKFRGSTTILVADFGGGTSDFSLIKFDRGGNKLKATPLGHAGLGIAGDTFDYRIVDHAVSPHLGKGGNYRSMGKIFTIPNSYYANFASWNHLSMMKANGELKDLIQLAKSAVDPKALAQLIDIVENDLGYALYKSVSETKIALSSAPQASFAFRHGSLDLRATIARSDFEQWIARDLAKISATLDQAMARAQVQPAQIDHVFLTGGSSLVPAVHHLFAERFGEEKLITGDHFVSIAYGLALIGQSADLSDWAWGSDKAPPDTSAT